MKAVLIAAGVSSRFWPFNDRHKSLARIMGHPLIFWTAQALKRAGVDGIAVVCRESDKAFLEQELGERASVFVQKEPRGTGHALWQAREFVTEETFVAWPSYHVHAEDMARKLLAKKQESGCDIVLSGASTKTPWHYGMFQLAGDRVAGIIEKPALGKEPSSIRNMGFQLLSPKFLEYYGRHANPEDEFSVVTCLDSYAKDNKTCLVEFSSNFWDLKYPWDLFGALEDIFFARPDAFVVADSARIAPGVRITGNVAIGENAVIKEGTVIEGPAYIGSNCEIGHHNVLRGPLNLEEGVKTGAFCEIKRSIIQKNAHLHSGYLGDSIVGEECRIGAGFVTANKRLDRAPVRPTVKGERVDSGRIALGVIIGKETRIGIQAGTMPGSIIGKNCIIGPGAMVKENVPDDMTIKQEDRFGL